jgi:hypothetical protein
LVGGHGGFGYGFMPAYVAQGGAGGVASADIAVTAGETLFVDVAADGAPGSTAGPGPGAPGAGNGGGENGAGGGGGASQIRTCSIDPASTDYCGPAHLYMSQLVVAGGGGGGGAAATSYYYNGGQGGDAGSAGGNGAISLATNGKGGQPGTPSAGGAAGVDSEPDAPSGPGRLGIGGDGGGRSAGGGGGGGAGLYGGGGGGGGQMSGYYQGAGGGGGGGASGVPADARGVSGFTASTAGPGVAPSVTVTWTMPTPTVTTGQVDSVSPATATLHGVVNPNGSPVSDCHFELIPAAPGGASIPCREQVGGDSAPVDVSATAEGLKAGQTYTVRLVVTGAQGTQSGSAISFSTPEAPRLTNLRQSRSRWHLGSRLVSISATRSRPRVGTQFSFSLSQSASVRLRFTRSKPGGSATAGTLTLAAHPGANMIRFNGRLSRTRRLTPGHYVLTFVATAQGLQSEPKSLKFTVLR